MSKSGAAYGIEKGSQFQRHLEGRFYLSVRQKFILATSMAVLWLAVSLWLAQPWIEELAHAAGYFVAYPIVLVIGLIPGFLNAHILMSVLLDNPPALPKKMMENPKSFPPVTVLIAAYNEQENLPETLMAIAKQDYPAPVDIVVVDDGSTDETVSVLKALHLPNLSVVQVNHGGKASALTAGLRAVTNEITVCMDADTLLHREALKRIVMRMVSDPEQTAAVAGCVLVRNSRANLIARLQEWDYFIGIASAKRQQALYQGTLVAQGSFSAFRTSALRQCQGWPLVIGEDIVLTWKLLSKGYRVGYEATAVGFTKAPATMQGFWRQRQRWARGMIEGLKRYGNLACQGNLTAFFVGVDFVVPVLDLFYSIVFLPGLLLALSGRFYIVGPMTLLVLPITLFIVLVMYQKQSKIFEELNLKVRRNSLGFVLFMLFYQALTSPICVSGYLKELAGSQKRW